MNAHCLENNVASLLAQHNTSVLFRIMPPFSPFVVFCDGLLEAQTILHIGPVKNLVSLIRKRVPGIIHFHINFSTRRVWPPSSADSRNFIVERFSMHFQTCQVQPHLSVDGVAYPNGFSDLLYKSSFHWVGGSSES